MHKLTSSLLCSANILEILYSTAIDSSISIIIVCQFMFVSLCITPSIHHNMIIAELVTKDLVAPLEVRQRIFSNTMPKVDTHYKM